MPTFHIHIPIATLLRMDDTELGETLTGGTPEQLRAELNEMKAHGKTVLTGANCDNQRPDGTCAGHEFTDLKDDK